MPNIQSAKKALRQNIRRKAINVNRKSRLGKIIKQYKKILEAGKTEEAKEQLKIVYKNLDKMAKVKFLKKGTADRMKSRLTKKLTAPKR